MSMSASNSSISTSPEFSVRIVVCDHYLTKPTPGVDVIYSEFRGSDVKQVPVLRIFGSASDGHKACLHVHGVFPYFYVPCPTSNPEPQFLYQIAASLDKALNIALKQATSANQHVYKITLVKGLPFYGFHDKEHLYLKVFLYSPNLIKQAVELCANGAILGQTFQPHESHLNFTLQFFIDFNLFGMSNVDLQSVKFRRSGVSQNSNELLDDSTVFALKPESICYYEADCLASHIINRQKIGKGDGIENPGLEEVWNQEKERRKQLNVSLASKSLSQSRLDVEQTESHHKFQKMCLVKLSGLIDKPVDVKAKREQVYYPAESLEGSQLLNAVDVSVHLPDSSLSDTLKRSLDETLTEELDNTLVDENLALNCSFSLNYSQVQLDNADLELVDMLQDLDEKPVEEDSILATPVDDAEIDADDAEYSQVFHDETLILDVGKSTDDISEENPTSWNDSFWDGANIPQLDGTCDDDHVKKVRKRKMRPFKLGLARPKSKQGTDSEEICGKNNLEAKTKIEHLTDHNVQINTRSIDDTQHETLNVENEEVINESRESVDLISDKYIKKLKKEMSSIRSDIQNNSDDCNESIQDLVNKITKKQALEKLGAAEKYDLQQQFEPTAGPSNVITKTDKCRALNVSLNESFHSTSSNKGITSFYDVSKMFDLSLDDSNVEEIDSPVPINDVELKMDELITEEYQEKTKISQCKYSDLPVNQPEAIIQGVKKSLEEENDDKVEPNFQLDFRETSTDGSLAYHHKIITPKFRPPTTNYVQSTLDKYNIRKFKHPEPYYSNHKDVGDKVEIGPLVLKLQSKLARDQKPYEKVLDTTSMEEWRQLMFLQTHEMTDDLSKPEGLKILLASNRRCILEPVKKPPTFNEAKHWVINKETNRTTLLGDKNNDTTDLTKNIEELDNSQAIGLIYEDDIKNSISLEANDEKQNKNILDTSLQVSMKQDGSFLCFGDNESQKNKNTPETTTVEFNFLTVMITEVLASVRGELYPDPLEDPIQAVFVNISSDCPPDHILKRYYTEIIVVDDMKSPKLLDRCVFQANITYVNTEIEMLEKVIALVKHHDPDIMCGYEIEINSWGYILERSQVLGLEIVQEVSRIFEKSRQKRWRGDEKDFEGRIIGRIMFNVWRLFRHELALSSYSFENCMYEILKERVPSYSYSQLFEWWSHESRMFRWIPVEHYLTRLSGTIRMLEKLDIINRTSELARLFGLQWWEVLSRGSQFRVESLMLRAARPLNLVALSPTVRQRAAMKAPECLPLIFEPESRFYSDPVIVLDFQSLYPSMMIAYNYCFSTCIGRAQNITGDTDYEFGAWRLRIPKSKLVTLVTSGLVHWSPVGAGFVSAGVRRGVLPALLRRILAARQAVKKGMRLQTDEQVKKAMHSRQLGLKLIANVTYGYTAANFSGRMPCVEVADSVVAKGRETLERAIRLVTESKRWNAKVVYGDTDSMFVLVPGGSRADAFRIGQEIADAVTADNPAPVVLKLEKVYQPCILQTKKRYVGYMYETADQEKPVYEAKGIETVRRDGCPAGVKLLQEALCSLFSHGDMSAVRRAVEATLARLAEGSLPPRDLLFTREYHGPAGYRPGASAPPNEIAKRIALVDRRAVPRAGWRVSWVVVGGPPGAPLVQLARSPAQLARSPALTPHVAYYATRVLLPPLHRCLSLLGVNVFKWWLELGYSRQAGQRSVQGGIARYMRAVRCAGCGAGGAGALCGRCARGGGARALAGRGAKQRTALVQCYQICGSCTGHGEFLKCESTECPVLWRRLNAQQKLTETNDVAAELHTHFNGQVFEF